MASYRLVLGLKGWYIQLFRPQELLAWAEGHQPNGPQILAMLTIPSNIPLNELTRQLLIKYGTNERVSNPLYANFQSGAFTGNMTNWLRRKLETAQKWSDDPAPSVKRWAKEVEDDLKKQIAKFQQYEEEEELS